MRLRRSRDEVVIDRETLIAHHHGVSVRVSDADLLDGAADLLRRLEPGFTEGFYGFWPISVRDGWVRDAERAIRTRVAQESLCWELDSEFEPPHADSTAVVSDLEGERLTLERFEYLRPQSGWVIKTGEGPPPSPVLGRLPLTDVVAARPDVLEFLALEPGWRVTIGHDGARVRRRAV
jgi:hypothetical protein